MSRVLYEKPQKDVEKCDLQSLGPWLASVKPDAQALDGGSLAWTAVKGLFKG